MSNAAPPPDPVHGSSHRRSHSQGRSHRHGHGHGHGHGLEGGWDRWLSVPALQVTLVAVVVAAVATVVGLVAVWPDGSGREAAREGADEVGLLTEQLPATVEEVVDGLCSYSTPDDRQNCRTVTFTVHAGPEAGALVVLPEFNLDQPGQAPDLAVGEKVILGYEDSTNFYFYLDRDRQAPLLWLGLVFVVVVLALGRLRGALALTAMALTVVALVVFVAPSVLDGNDPLLVSVVAASVIAFVSLYLTHGVTPTTTVALAGTLGALGLTLAISWVFFGLARFTGYATEAGLILPLISDIDVPALLLGGAVLGALGALDDVTVTQVATVAELHRTDPSLSVAQLMASGIRVGREHIASAVNTLLLAYAGASMPLLLLFAASDQSLTKVANGELVAVEIVRTLCGSIGLVAAVPVTTLMAAVLVASDPTDHDRQPDEAPPSSVHGHHAGPGLGGHRHDDVGPRPDPGDGPDGRRPEPPRAPGVDPARPHPGPAPTAGPVLEHPPHRSPSWEQFGPEDEDLW